MDKKSVSAETKKFPPKINIYQNTLSSFPENSSILKSLQLDPQISHVGTYLEALKRHL